MAGWWHHPLLTTRQPRTQKNLHSLLQANAHAKNIWCTIEGWVINNYILSSHKFIVTPQTFVFSYRWVYSIKMSFFWHILPLKCGRQQGHFLSVTEFIELNCLCFFAPLLEEDSSLLPRYHVWILNNLFIPSWWALSREFLQLHESC